MKKFESLEVGDSVEIKNPDEFVKEFLKEKLFNSLDIEHLRMVCQIQKDKKYTVADNCKSCKILKIKLGEKWLSVKYKFLKD
jgi:hypothetical protein